MEELDEKEIASQLKEHYHLSELPVFHGIAKHVFSHRVHYLGVCSTSVSAMPSVKDYAWWTPREIQKAGTTSWLLLMLKTAKKAVSLYK